MNTTTDIADVGQVVSLHQTSVDSSPKSTQSPVSQLKNYGKWYDYTQRCKLTGNHGVSSVLPIK